MCATSGFTSGPRVGEWPIRSGVPQSSKTLLSCHTRVPDIVFMLMSSNTPLVWTMLAFRNVKKPSRCGHAFDLENAKQLGSSD